MAGIKSTLSKPIAHWAHTKITGDSLHAAVCQERILRMLIRKGTGTIFGKAHRFREIRSYPDFTKHVPLTDYEIIRPLIERISKGDKDILWPGLPLYFAKTSGTTSGSKYIPITRDSITNHTGSARDALLMYMYRSGNYAFADHQMIFLQGSPVLGKKGIIPSGRLSGIVAHHVPAYLQKNRMPSWKTNCIEDWETKVDAIVNETLQERMSLISGIPSWLRMYFEKLVEKAGKPVGEIFPDFSVLVYGGLNFEPYRQTFEKLIGRQVDTIELFPASEGFIAYQDGGPGEGLLLNINSGIFFEFIPVAHTDQEIPERIPLEAVRTGEDYEIVLNSNAGLWGYRLGDLVRFVSVNPYRLVVSGRVSQYISAFGEHVIASEVESALAEVCASTGTNVSEFTVAPVVNPSGGLPHHVWLIEAENQPDVINLATRLDSAMCRKNTYYRDLIDGRVLEPLHVVALPPGTFDRYMESMGRLGGQNKVIRLSDNMEMAENLMKMTGMEL